MSSAPRKPSHRSHYSAQAAAGRPSRPSFPHATVSRSCPLSSLGPARFGSTCNTRRLRAEEGCYVRLEAVPQQARSFDLGAWIAPVL